MHTSSRIPFSVYLISLSLGLGLACAVIAVTISALAGTSMTNLPYLATLPFGMQFAAMIPASLISSNLMRHHGRKKIILFACISGIASGFIGAWAVQVSSLLLLALSHALLGIFLANINLLRFTALDMTDRSIHAKVLTLVLFGGVFAAVIGPTLARNAELFLPISGFAATYLTISMLAATVAVIISMVSVPGVQKEQKKESIPASTVIRSSGFLFAAFCGGGGYFLMSLLMVAASLFLHHHPMLVFNFETISLLIQGHVIAMYLPSLVSGRILKALGVWRFLFIGVALQIGSNLAAIIGGSTAMYLLSLVLLGVAWNVLYTAGTYILGALFTGPEKFKAQGLNDMIVAILQTIATLFAAGFLAIFGWSTLNVFSILVVLFLLFYAFTIKAILQRISFPEKTKTTPP